MNQHSSYQAIKSLKYLLPLLAVFMVLFSNLPAEIFSRLGLPKLAEQLKIFEAHAVTDTFIGSGSWVAPAGVTSATIEAWGGGGGGGGQNLASDGGGGGGGGAYSQKNSVTVVPGNSYTVTVGSAGGGGSGACGTVGGDSWFINTATVLAKGGVQGCHSTGTPPAGGLGGAAASGVGDTKFSGGQGEKGRDNATGQGGYGGSSAGTAAAGWSGPQTWSTVTYPTANTPAGGGHGGDGGTANANGSAPASGEGGGGGGSGEGQPKIGGAGKGGKVNITYTVPPDATSLTNSTDGTLTDGGRSGHSITLTGSNFGTVLAGSRANCAGSTGTGCVRLVVGGSATVADGDVTAWADTSITFTVQASLASLGGSAALEVVRESTADPSPLTFFVYPNVTGMAVCTGCNTNAAREHAAGVDTDGLIMLQGDHFGSTTGTVDFVGGFGSIAGTIHATAEGPCTTGGWSAAGFTSNTACVEVNTSIGDSTYTGLVRLTQSGAKNDDIDLRVLPRITANNPNAGVVGDIIQLAGNHFCQSGSCPISPNRSIAADNVKFGTTQAADSDFVNQTAGAGTCNGVGAAWAHAEICVRVPTGTPSGSQPTKVTSNTSYTSNTQAFTRQTTIPNNPTNLGQFKSDGSTTIATGGTTNESSVVLKGDISVSVSANIAIQVEVKAVGTAFACGAGDCAAAVEGTVVGGGACTSCTSLTAARVTVSSLTDGTKHWQARVRNTTTNEYSSWVSYPTPTPNLETETDFKVDTTAPTITFAGANICSDATTNLASNSVTISWSLSESADGQVEYSKNADLTASANSPSTPAALAVSHAINLQNLDSGTTYYFKVKSRDAASNLATRPSVSPFCSFSTSSVTQPGKTTSFHIVGNISSITAASTYYWTVTAPETSPSVKSAYVEVSGLVSGGSNPITVQVNGVASRAYAVSATNPTAFKFVYQISSPNTETNLNLNDAAPCTNGAGAAPPCNKLIITPGAGMTVNISSARLVMNYGYTP